MGGSNDWKFGVLTGTEINGFGLSVPKTDNDYWSIFFVSLGVQGFPKFMLTTNIFLGIWRLGDTGVGMFAHYGAEGAHSLRTTLSTLSVLPGYRF